MGVVVYALCTIAALGCAVLILRAYGMSRTRLLLWAGLCFTMFALNNALIVVDLVIFLLLLYSDGGDWTLLRVAEEMRIPENVAASHLQDLELRGLLERGAAANSYRFAASADTVPCVAALAEAYRDMRYSVINLIFSVPGDSARSLAEAFRIRKRKDE